MCDVTCEESWGQSWTVLLINSRARPATDSPNQEPQSVWAALSYHQPPESTPRLHPAEQSVRTISCVYDRHHLAYFARIIAHAVRLFSFPVDCFPFAQHQKDVRTFSRVLIFASLVFKCY